MERRLNVCSLNWCWITISLYVWATSVWYVLVPDSFTSYSRTDTNRLEYCEWLNSDGEDGGRNNAGGRGEIDDDGGDGGRGQELDVEVKKKMESPSPMTSLSSFLVPCSWAYGEVSRGILYSLLESLLSNLVLSRRFSVSLRPISALCFTQLLPSRSSSKQAVWHKVW